MDAESINGGAIRVIGREVRPIDDHPGQQAVRRRDRPTHQRRGRREDNLIGGGTEASTGTTLHKIGRVVIRTVDRGER